MNPEPAFVLALKESIRSPDFFGPLESLAELTALESGLATYCYGFNRRVELGFGDDHVDLWLFPDLLPHIGDIPDKLVGFLGEGELAFEFSARALSLRCRASGDLVDCCLEAYGARTAALVARCSREALVDAWLRLLGDILDGAVAEDCISPADAASLRQRALTPTMPPG